MWENQNQENPGEPEVIKPTYEELEKQLADTKAGLDYANLGKTTLRDRLYEANYKIEKADEYLTENWDSLGKHAEELCEALGLDVEVSKSITITATITVEVSAKRGTNFEDLNEYDFDITVDSGNSDFEVSDYNFDFDRVSVS